MIPGARAAGSRRRAARRLGIALALATLSSGVAAGARATVAIPADSTGADIAAAPAREEPFVKRALRPFSGQRWIGQAIAYGPYRDGQGPGGAAPTKAELRQDLRLLSRRWGLLRLYGAVGPSQQILEIIHEDHLDMKVMLGVWLGVEQRGAGGGGMAESLSAGRGGNRGEIEAAVRLAAAYPGIVLAVCVGNETQVSWSSHRIPPELLIGYLREMRARTRVPVATADDFSYWKEPGSRAVASETDFIVAHLHPLWNGQPLEEALDWTRRRLGEVQAVHPGETVVIGETGWATRKHDEGEQATLIRGRPGEPEQKAYYDAFTAWAGRRRIVTFFFEAFDENWKGGPHPDDVEKHWGLFRSDRSPKEAMADGR